jgi:hypothetical protein
MVGALASSRPRAYTRSLRAPAKAGACEAGPVPPLCRTLNTNFDRVGGPDENPPTGPKFDPENPDRRPALGTHPLWENTVPHRSCGLTDSEANCSTSLDQKEKESGDSAQLP